MNTLNVAPPLIADRDLPAAAQPGRAVAVPAAVMEGVVDDEQELARSTTWVQDAAGLRMAESHLQLSGLWCAACAAPIEDALRAVAGVSEARVAASVSRAVVRWDPARTRLSALIQAVHRVGYGAVPDGAVTQRQQRLRESRMALWRWFVAAFCSMQVMMFLTPSYVAGPGELGAEMQRLLAWGAWLLSLPVLAFSATPFFAGAWRSWRTRRISMDVPVALGIAVTFLASTAAMADPSGVFGHEVYFDSLTMFVAFLLGARWFETRIRHRAATWLEEAAVRLPELARRIRADGTVETVALHHLRVGDRLRVPAGETLAADGVVLDGATRVDEALLTGESRPIAKAQGSQVIAGSLNLDHAVDVQVQAVGADTQQAGIVALMRDAATQRPEVSRLADRWAGPFLWAVLLLAALSAAAWSFIDPSRAVWVAVSVLIVTCPCALSLAVPSALVAAAGHLARRGILLRSMEALETLARVRVVVFDKTGTLTQDPGDALQLQAGHDAAGGATDTASARRVWHEAAALASHSSHPVSRAIASAAASLQINADDVHAPVWREVIEVPGQGLMAKDASGCAWRLGSRAWVLASRQNHAAYPGDVLDDVAGDVRACFAAEDGPVWTFVGVETLRPEALSMRQSLAAMGVDVMLLSGDRAPRVRALAAAMGAVSSVAEASPDQKLDAVRTLQIEGRTVAMVGDGLNDAPVVAQADVSIAMGSGAAVTRSQADAVLVANDLGALPLALALSRRTVRVIRQNLLWAAAYNAACIPLAMMGWLPPWAAGLGMALSSTAVILNAQRLAR